MLLGIYPLEYFTTKTAESDRIVTDDGFVFIKPTRAQGWLGYTGYCLAYSTGEYSEDLVEEDNDGN